MALALREVPHFGYGEPSRQLRGNGAGMREREADLAAAWAGGAWRGCVMRAEDGQDYTVVFQGRPGGGAGPDFRDAVIECADGRRLYGDIELHLRPSGWHAHGHDSDARYDRLVLHVVSANTPTSDRTTRLASGRLVPLVVLRHEAASGPMRATQLTCWPCEVAESRLAPGDLVATIDAAGDERFNGRASAAAAALVQELRAVSGSHARWEAVDRALFVSLAEALAYGRDRGRLRVAGERLAAGMLPGRALSMSADWPDLERRRLRGLLALRAQWNVTGPWSPLRQALVTGEARTAAELLVAALTVPTGLVSPGRALILVANVVLPYASAIAGVAGEDADMGARARAVYAALPGLPSNAITRAMIGQLGLTHAPSGARGQQGLHHVWAMHCREKACHGCPCRR